MSKTLDFPIPKEKSEIIPFPDGSKLFLDGATWDELDPRDKQALYEILEQHNMKNHVLALKEMEGNRCHGQAPAKRAL